MEGCEDCKQLPGFTCDEESCKTICGDGIKTGIEECDSVHGCYPDCTARHGYECLSNLNECSLKCGNGRVDDDEVCDDPLDLGCSEHCTAECGWTCVPGEACEEICGDGEVVGSEACDHWGLDDMGCNLDCTE